ncbi:hypothetical protein BRDID11002_07320 [Bradyrhizobium diazoefficiens]
MHVEAIGALRGERDRERNQLAIFRRDQAVLALDGMIEGEEGVGPSTGASATKAGTDLRSSEF